MIFEFKEVSEISNSQMKSINSLAFDALYIPQDISPLPVSSVSSIIFSLLLILFFLVIFESSRNFFHTCIIPIMNGNVKQYDLLLTQKDQIANAKRNDDLRTAPKIPFGDTPYSKAKKTQLIDKDQDLAISLFRKAIFSGDCVDSALKDMAVAMKQQNRSEEAIDAIKSLRHICSGDSQESLDNILLDMYKKCGNFDCQIAVLRKKLQRIKAGLAFNGKKTKTAKSNGRKFQVSIQEEEAKLLGNLGWALMQKENYKEAEEAYRNAVLIQSDNNKMCNLGICLMKQGKIIEAKNALKQVKPPISNGSKGTDPHSKAYETAQALLLDLESKFSRYERKTMKISSNERAQITTETSNKTKSMYFYEEEENERAQVMFQDLESKFIGSHRLFLEPFYGSSIWKPHPCIDCSIYLHMIQKENTEDLMKKIETSEKRQLPGDDELDEEMPAPYLAKV